jgi:hypothetical protein
MDYKLPKPCVSGVLWLVSVRVSTSRFIYGAVTVTGPTTVELKAATLLIACTLKL